MLLLLLGLVRFLARPTKHPKQPPGVPPPLLLGHGRLLRRHTRSRRGWHQEVRGTEGKPPSLFLVVLLTRLGSIDITCRHAGFGTDAVGRIAVVARKGICRVVWTIAAFGWGVFAHAFYKACLLILLLSFLRSVRVYVERFA